MAGIGKTHVGISKPLVVLQGELQLTVIGDVYRRSDMQRQVVIYLVQFRQVYGGRWKWSLSEKLGGRWEQFGESKNSHATILDAREEVLSVAVG